MAQQRVLVADDDANIRMLLKDFLGQEGCEVSEAQTGKEVLAIVDKGNAPALVLMDVRMPELTGIEVLKRLKDARDVPGILVMTAFGTSNLAIQAIQLGAFDYITKPFELDEVLVAFKRFFEHKSLEADVQSLRRQLGSKDAAERIVGRSARMLDVYKTIGRISGSDATVLITGETGTGKELVAEVVHQSSVYRQGQFVKVGCASFPETLLESELFGHEKGSFSGAYAQRLGRFEIADKGTIFFDEIGEMTLAMQKKLLRVLQEKEFERVGGNKTIKVDCLVVAATNRNLAEEVARGNFREDLYYRLNVITIHMPSLRDRKDDVPLLVDHFLDRHRLNAQTPPAEITGEAMQYLEQHDWPGNVGELENTVERAVILARGGPIRKEHLTLIERVPERTSQQTAYVGSLLDRKVPYQLAVSDFQRRLLAEAFDRAGLSVDIAASMLDLEIKAFLKHARDAGVSTDEPGANGRGKPSG